MNTDGGILLLGVSDEGTVMGPEADGFASEDKCRLHFKNLVNQHRGFPPSLSGLTGESRCPPPTLHPDFLDARLRGRDGCEELPREYRFVVNGG